MFATIEVWQARLDISPQLGQKYWAVLNAEEQKRANRFVRGEHQTRFIAGRGILRSLLGQYLNLPPEQIEFDYLPQGKPILGKKHSFSNLQFNVSHSQDLALYAISTEYQQVGIDLEWIRPFPQVLSLARRFFTEQEFADLVSLPSKQQERTFFQLWTAKEAYLKATGEGLKGLQTIEIKMDQDSQQFEVRRSQAKVSLYSFTPTSDFIATVASLENDHSNLTQQSDQVPDTSNKLKVEDRYSCDESLENQLVFHNWDE
ncbi:4'-phosphopantetheinyl transferase [Halothece sp. PCC 7418]|nr:4'-phosphopantetheinyl transferase [Halothece sp. PCC 7418]